MIPDFQSIMLPILNILKDNNLYSNIDIRQQIITIFTITEDEQKLKTPSKQQFTFSNRVAWALAYLKKSQLIASPARGQYQITEAGLAVLKNSPENITIAFLNQLENNDIDITKENLNDRTPIELIEIGYQKTNEALIDNIIEKIKEASPYFFERLVLDLLIKLGYGGSEIENSQLTSRGADGGIDGIIKEDKLGLDKIYVQAKKWENNISRPEIQKFVGALQGKGASKGIFITISKFTADCKNYVNDLRNISIVLIDGEGLAQYMIETGLGLNLQQSYNIYSIDLDYFSEE